MNARDSAQLPSAGDALPHSPGIELRHLRYFVAVYEELHFGRAAERLHIAQPPLSQAILKLEREVGVRLLERTSRTVVPTDAGHVLAEEARKVLASFEFAVAETRRVSRLEPPLRVGCVNYVPSRQLQRFLMALYECDVDLRAEVMHMLGLEQVDRLRAGELDLGVFAHAEDYEGLEWERLFPGEQLKLFLPKTHRLATKRVLGPGDLWGETLLNSPRAINPVLYDSFMVAMEDSGYRFAGQHEMSTTDVRDRLLAVAGGLGIALGPASLADESLALECEVISLPLNPSLAFPDTIVAWRANPPRQLASRLASVREAASELFGQAPVPGVEPTA